MPLSHLSTGRKLLTKLRMAALQPMYEKMHRVLLYLMNYGAGGWDQSGEQQVLQFLAKKMSKTPTILDVGANTGEWSTAALEAMPQADIHAFEPHPTTYKKLKQNKHITSYNIALSDSEGITTLHSSSTTDRISTLQERQLEHRIVDGKSINFDTTFQVEQNTLDRWCTQHKITHIDLLKIDVEGLEWKVLQGAKQMLAHTDVIQFEFSEANVDSRVFFKDFRYLLEKDFQIYRILPKGLRQISSYDERYEIFTCTNYLCLRKK